MSFGNEGKIKCSFYFKKLIPVRVCIKKLIKRLFASPVIAKFISTSFHIDVPDLVHLALPRNLNDKNTFYTDSIRKSIDVEITKELEKSINGIHAAVSNPAP